MRIAALATACLITVPAQAQTFESAWPIICGRDYDAQAAHLIMEFGEEMREVGMVKGNRLPILELWDGGDAWTMLLHFRDDTWCILAHGFAWTVVLPGSPTSPLPGTTTAAGSSPQGLLLP